MEKQNLSIIISKLLLDHQRFVIFMFFLFMIKFSRLILPKL